MNCMIRLKLHGLWGERQSNIRMEQFFFSCIISPFPSCGFFFSIFFSPIQYSSLEQGCSYFPTLQFLLLYSFALTLFLACLGKAEAFMWEDANDWTQRSSVPSPHLQVCISRVTNGFGQLVHPSAAGLGVYMFPVQRGASAFCTEWRTSRRRPLCTCRPLPWACSLSWPSLRCVILLYDLMQKGVWLPFSHSY